MSDVKRCAACGKENPVSEMKVCMHHQMHRYVCDSKCMTDFYNPPKKPTAAELEAKVAALEAEIAALRAGQEPVAVVDKHVPSAEIQWTEHGEELCLPHGTNLYTTPQPSAVPDAVTMADVMRAWEYAEDHPHKYLRGTTNWCAAVAHSLNQRSPSAPATVQGGVKCATCRDVGIIGHSELCPECADSWKPATVRGVNAQLLEALEFAAKSLATMTSADGSGHADIALCVLRMACYDADERERMVEAWKQKTQWRIDAAIAAAQEGGKV